MSGGQRSEVKEEGRTQSAPGDTSGVVYPASVARTKVEHDEIKAFLAAKCSKELSTA